MNKQNEAKAQLSRAFVCKGDSMEERLYKKTLLFSNFEYSFAVTLCLTFKYLFLSVFSYWESAKPIFIS